ncbi:hypothetical protein ACGFY3_08885 [Streptomyces mirabilis]|jgi:hypothetical protein|uniref:DUF7144 family membrane protein n=1 Tax=Streptomyces TaxID=1883 RepID=UPI000BB0DA65|nr:MULTISPECIES: hypothetical protein [Streptomyces]MCX4431792.1 hypothetical protein [Streptomyces mirabilis]PBD01092.1 hypothetical protein BX281_9239 [Streptomyces sp. Ag82_O1-15]SOE77905.1 hypothetical protein SAMN05446589_7648 [Streptomyces sp. OV198]
MTTTGMHQRRETGSGGAWASSWTAFAAVMMIFGGVMAIFEGISAIAEDDVFVLTRNYAYNFNLTSWGWIHLSLGVLVVLAGAALFTGAMWARVVGVVLAGLSMIANFMWLPYYPVWAIVLIAVDAFVIWALCVGISRQPRTE